MPFLTKGDMEELALIIESISKFLKKMGKQSKSAVKSLKGKNSSTLADFNKKNK